MRFTLRVVAIGFALRALLAAWLPLTPDEAYYVNWAKHLSLGYLDHPPLVAWLIAPSLALFGHRELAVRLPALLLQAITTLLIVSLARRHNGERAARSAALIAQVIPVFSLGGMLMTPDAPLSFAWALTFWTLDRAETSERPSRLLWVGVALGVAALSKLTAGLLGLALLAAFLRNARGRLWLRTPFPWVAALIALTIASPMLYWNAVHGWPALAFQAHHGARGGSFSVKQLFESLGAQLGYVSPVFAALAAWAGYRGLRGRPQTTQTLTAQALAYSGLPLIFFFTAFASITPGALPHWPAPGWLSCALLLVMNERSLSDLKPKIVWIAGSIGAALTAVVLLALFLPLPARFDPLQETRGWAQAAQQADQFSEGQPIAVTQWMALGQFSWYAHSEVLYAGPRQSAASYYQRPDALEQPLLLVTVDGLGPQAAEIAELAPLHLLGSLQTRHLSGAPRHFRFYDSAGSLPAH